MQRSTHILWGEWSSSSKSHVASMSEGDFYGSELSTTISNACTVRIVFTDANGTSTNLKEFFFLTGRRSH